MAYFSSAPNELGYFGCGADCSCKSCRTATANFSQVYEEEEPPPPPRRRPSRSAPQLAGFFGRPPLETIYGLGQVSPQCEAIPEKYKLRDINKLTSGRTNCPTQADAVRILRTTVARAVEMLDNTIGELVRARDAACRGGPLGWPALGEVTACWLKYRLGVCIDDLSTWTKGPFRKSLSEPTSVAEVIRRLVVPRNLLATNQITYVCEATCDPGVNAFTVVRAGGQCIRTPDRIIHLCPPFWSNEHAEFREQTIIHEAVHLTHCAPHGTTERATGIGWPECLAQFVVATNGKRLDPGQSHRCGFITRCGVVSEGCRGKPKSGGTQHGPTKGRVVLPDWRP
jgi:hypothetical protein